MATERTWEVITTVNGEEMDTPTAQDDLYYTYSFQKTSKLLYYIKEALVDNLSWHVVSSSYRTDSGNPTATGMTFTADSTDGWLTGSDGSVTGSVAPCDVVTVTTGGNTYYNAVTSSSPVGINGRSWILLKHSASSLSMQENSNQFYHIVIDYCTNLANPNNNTSETSAFGADFNIILFAKAPTNPLGTPSPKLRPHDPNEIIINKASALFRATDATTPSPDKLYVLKDTSTKGFILLLTGAGKFRGFIAMNTFSDHPDGQDGKVFAMGYSQTGEADVKLNSTSKYTLLAGWGTTAPTLATNQIIRGVSSYNAGTQTYTYKPFITCLPAFTTSAFTTWMTFYLTKKTTDNSYIEWPFPVLDISSVTAGTYAFKGRLPDIKLGPASGTDGVMSKPTEVSDYDRVLLSGIWFPWAGNTQIEL